MRNGFERGEACPHKPSENDLIATTANANVYAARFRQTWLDLFEDIKSNLPDGVIPDVRMHRKFWQIFLRGWLVDLLHIEINRDNMNFSIGVHLERAAAKDAHCVAAITTRMKLLKGFKRESLNWGRSWNCRADHSDLAAKVLTCARGISGLSYNTVKPPSPSI